MRRETDRGELSAAKGSIVIVRPFQSIRLGLTHTHTLIHEHIIHSFSRMFSLFFYLLSHSLTLSLNSFFLSPSFFLCLSIYVGMYLISSLHLSSSASLFRGQDSLQTFLSTDGYYQHLCLYESLSQGRRQSKRSSFG